MYVCAIFREYLDFKLCLHRLQNCSHIGSVVGVQNCSHYGLVVGIQNCSRYGSVVGVQNCSHKIRENTGYYFSHLCMKTYIVGIH